MTTAADTDSALSAMVALADAAQRVEDLVALAMANAGLARRPELFKIACDQVAADPQLAVALAQLAAFDPALHVSNLNPTFDPKLQTFLINPTKN